MKTKENISLIGMPAVGKSTVGALLAKKIGYGFQDTDILIQSKEGMTLAQIIDTKGLDGFLDIEAGHIISLGTSFQVIATGGSVVYREAAMARLAELSTIVYLAADLPTLMERLSDPVARGVVFDPDRGLEALYKERTPLYERFCDIKVDCGQMDPDQVTTTLFTALSKTIPDL